jgi:hypothetical protein
MFYLPIKIDDLSFIDDTFCQIQPSEVLDELATLTPFPTTTQPPQPTTQEITCNFDSNNTCGWQNDPKARLAWMLNKGNTETVYTFVYFYFFLSIFAHCK